MLRPVYVIMVPMDGDDAWFELTRVYDAAHCGEVVRVLMLTEERPEAMKILKQKQLIPE